MDTDEEKVPNNNSVLGDLLWMNDFSDVPFKEFVLPTI